MTQPPLRSETKSKFDEFREIVRVESLTNPDVEAYRAICKKIDDLEKALLPGKDG